MLSDDPLWYKDAIIYELHVKAFYDSNGDGAGDFRGLTEKLDYIRDLGVNAIWLLPFYPSPLRDDGYDISDYHNVHAAYGSIKDFRHFVKEAHRRDLRVITELVINHTSDQHPWFQAARRAPKDSAKREYYVWSDTVKKFEETRIIFTDSETSNWAWDPVAQQYYWHRFFSHQPDLNHNNPHVVKAVTRVMRYWFDSGVDGMRLDAIPYLCVREGTNNENLPETHEVLKQMRAELDAHYKNRMFLAEANQWPEDVRPYFGEGDECHMAYHFPLMPRIYMAIAQEDRHPIVEIIKQTPEIPDNCQWAIFLRNHDELTLEMVTDRERDYMYEIYATDPRMRVNVGIRRRLAPLMENNRDKIELLNSLLFSMPGSPIVYYGDELGMGDNVYLGDRNGVRTPMQWSPDRNGGFSKADPAKLYLPVIMDPVYGYEAVNVEAQSRSFSSLLNWTKRLIAVRNAHKVFGRGTLKFLRPGNRKILAYLREYETTTVLCIANLSRSAQPVELDLSAFKGFVPIEMMGRTPFPPIGDLPYLLTLRGYGFYWFELAANAEVPAWHEDTLPPAELPVVVLVEEARSLAAQHAAPLEALQTLFDSQARTRLETEVFQNYITGQRWFGLKGDVIDQTKIIDHSVLHIGDRDWLLCWIEMTPRSARPQRYFLPLALTWEESQADRSPHLSNYILAKVRQKSKVGFLCDAFGDDAFCQAILDAIKEQSTIQLATGMLEFMASASLTTAMTDDLAIQRQGLEQSNTSIVFGDKFILKAYRRVNPGINPDIEMTRYLTEEVNFQHIAPWMGTGVYTSAELGPITLLSVQAYVRNQGNGWDYTLDYLGRWLDTVSLESNEAKSKINGVEAASHAIYLSLIRKLGTRLGQLHAALARDTDKPEFKPEPINETDFKKWANELKDAAQMLDRLQQFSSKGDDGTATLVAALFSQRDKINEIIEMLAARPIRAKKTRLHGDLHLGQVLLVENDFIIIDFEGEPARPLTERRIKSSPLRDVAGMLRSFDYAAHSALARFTSQISQDVSLFENQIQEWRRQTVQCFTEGYLEAVRDIPSMPDSSQDIERLITLFTWQKVFYELYYELDNRPDWVNIPIKGILGLIKQSDN